MNKERLELLADHLEKLPREQFDLTQWCGTACCVAGHAIALAGEEGKYLQLDMGPSGAAASLLGLDDKTSDRLFAPDDLGPEKAYSDVEPQQAASVIRHLIQTGKVEWERFV